jgi:hypothetical protein
VTVSIRIMDGRVKPGNDAVPFNSAGVHADAT